MYVCTLSKSFLEVSQRLAKGRFRDDFGIVALSVISSNELNPHECRFIGRVFNKKTGYDFKMCFYSYLSQSKFFGLNFFKWPQNFN